MLGLTSELLTPHTLIEGNRNMPSRVLIVEDNPKNLFILRAHMEPLNVQCLEAADGQTALELVAKEAPDVVLLDVVLPKLDGFEVCRRIRQMPDRYDIPILLVTALSTREDRLKGLEAGADDFITKPVDGAELRAKMRTLVRLNRYRKNSEQQARFETLLRHNPDAVVLMRSDGELLHANPALFELFNLQEPSIKSAEPTVRRALEPLLQHAFIHTEKGEHAPSLLTKELSLPGLQPHENRLVEWRTATLHWDGRPACLIMLRDISERRRAEIERHRHLYFNSVTNLPNRAYLHELLRESFTRQPEETQCALVLMDLDRFSNLNESLGYVLGDEVLLALSKRLQEHVRPTDLLFSLGEDEFAMLIYDESWTPGLPAKLAEDMRQRVALPLEVQAHVLFLSASVGVAVRQPYHQVADELLRDAYTALKEAKSRRGNRCFLFEPEMHARAIRRQQLENELRIALQKHQLTLFYQPVVSLREPGRVGFEALMRWCHPERGMVPPSEFIPLAEDSGLIIPLGLMALRSACQQLQAWRETYGEDAVHRVSVNLSVAQLRRPEFISEVQQVLRETQVPPELLWLEVTESLVIDDPESAIRCLEALHGLGLRLMLDDFGTGYSSLSYLQKLPLSGLKIDRAFVQQLGEASKELDIVRMITALAHRLGLIVVAEGVETAEQLAPLKSIDCDFVQGYYHGKPQAPSELVGRWLKRPTP